MAKCVHLKLTWIFINYYNYCQYPIRTHRADQEYNLQQSITLMTDYFQEESTQYFLNNLHQYLPSTNLNNSQYVSLSLPAINYPKEHSNYSLRPHLSLALFPLSNIAIKSIIMLQHASEFIIQKSMSVILYQDSQVTIYPELLVIKKYYFPLATSKTILISDIERVGLYSSEGVAHRWGVCGKYLNNWFPYDGNRKNKTKFIEIILKGGKTRPSITPDDPDAAFKIIWENFTKEGRDYVEHQSQLHDGKETELAREEMMKEGDTSEQVIQNVKKSPKEMIKVEAVDE